MRTVSFIVIHCSATMQDFPVQYIQSYWRKTLKWKEPGYHFLIDKYGKIQYLQDIDKPANGVKGYNENSIHICYLGGIDKVGNSVDNRSIEQKEAKIALLTELYNKFPTATILGHNDFPGVQKDCPCFDVRHWLKEINFFN